MLDVNLLGAAPGIKHAFLAMRPRGPAGRGGSVSSLASVAATPAPGTPARQPATASERSRGLGRDSALP
jgi:hypothetical protein